jgi:hypothetical protein
MVEGSGGKDTGEDVEVDAGEGKEVLQILQGDLDDVLGGMRSRGQCCEDDRGDRSSKD